MIDRLEVEAELREARRARIKAQAAGRHLEMLVRRLSRSRHPWQWVEPAVLQRFESALPHPYESKFATDWSAAA